MRAKLGCRPASPSAICRKSRKLNPAKDVLGNVEEAVAGTRKILARFDEINARLGEPIEPDEMEKLLEEQAKVQDAIEAHNAWELDRQIEIAMDAMNLRRETPASKISRVASAAASRSARFCSSGLTSCCSTNRRTISTPRASPGWSGIWPSTPARSSP